MLDDDGKVVARGKDLAELQQRLNHPVAFGHGQSDGTSIGFATDVPLAGPIQKTGGVVMTYTIDGNFGGPRYFRGLNLERTSVGPDGWRPGGRRVTPARFKR